jgi:hypothetical protein
LDARIEVGDVRLYQPFTVTYYVAELPLPLDPRNEPTGTLGGRGIGACVDLGAAITCPGLGV